MSRESDIPLLRDVISPGKHIHPVEAGEAQVTESADGDLQLDFQDAETQNEENVIDDPNLKELIIDEEIRSILDRHMENAYEEIIRLLNNRIN